MQFSPIEAAIEAILFSVGEAVPLKKIAEAVGLEPEPCSRIIDIMSEKFDLEGRGVRIIKLEDSFQMCTNSAYYDQVKAVTNKLREFALTDVLIETLSIIAYKQPITKTHIESIRGVNSNHAVNKLVEYNLVCEVGRMNAPGRPILFGTTKEFLRSFGMHSVDELPELAEDQLTLIKSEVEQEVQLSLLD